MLKNYLKGPLITFLDSIQAQLNRYGKVAANDIQLLLDEYENLQSDNATLRAEVGKKAAWATEMQKDNQELRFCLDSINYRACPGTTDSIDAMKGIIREHATQKARIGELESNIRHLERQVEAKTDMMNKAYARVQELEMALSSAKRHIEYVQVAISTYREVGKEKISLVKIDPPIGMALKSLSPARELEVSAPANSKLVQENEENPAKSSKEPLEDNAGDSLTDNPNYKLLDICRRDYPHGDCCRCLLCAMSRIGAREEGGSG